MAYTSQGGSNLPSVNVPLRTRIRFFSNIRYNVRTQTIIIHIQSPQFTSKYVEKITHFSKSLWRPRGLQLRPRGAPPAAGGRDRLCARPKRAQPRDASLRVIAGYGGDALCRGCRGRPSRARGRTRRQTRRAPTELPGGPQRRRQRRRRRRQAVTSQQRRRRARASGVRSCDAQSWV